MGCANTKEREQKEQLRKQRAEKQARQEKKERQAEKLDPSKLDPNSTDLTRVEDNYEVGDEIGRGAFSVVRKGRHKKTGRDFAIKFIEKKFVDKQDLLLLGREIDIMKKVTHPNVLQLEEVFETDEIIALVMELVVGGELFLQNC